MKRFMQGEDRTQSTLLTAFADRGYIKGEEILGCHEAGIAAIVPKSMTSSAKAHRRFDKADFIYDAATNEFRSPAGEHLIWRYSNILKQVGTEMSLHVLAYKLKRVMRIMGTVELMQVMRA